MDIKHFDSQRSSHFTDLKYQNSCEIVYALFVDGIVDDIEYYVLSIENYGDLVTFWSTVSR